MSAKTYRLKNLHRTAHEKNTFLYGRKNGRTHIPSSEKKNKRLSQTEKPFVLK